MELKYDLKLTDVIQFYLHTGKSSKINLRKMRNKKIKIFLISLGISFVLQWLFIRQVTSVYYWSSLIIASLTVIIYSFYTDRLIARKFRKFHKHSREPNLFGTYRLVIRKEGLEEMVEDGQRVLYKWKDILNVVKEKNYIYIYVDAIRAIIVPIRVFSTNEDCHIFLTKIKRYILDSTKQHIEVKEK